MRIAVCFSGQLRFVNEYSKNILDNLINLYQTDVFAHLWWDESMIGKNFHHEFNDVYNERIEDFVKIYNPKKISVESQYTKFDECQYVCSSKKQNFSRLSNLDILTAIFRMESQWYSVKQSYDLVEHPEQYDFIVRLRTDCHLTKPIIFDSLQKNILYIQSGKGAGADRKYCDWFALGSNDLMKEYMNTYSNYTKHFSGGFIHMHRFMELTLSDRNINVTDFEFGVPINHSFYKYHK